MFAKYTQMDRGKRIRLLRRLIVTAVLLACLVPTCICVILAVRYDRTQTRLRQAAEDLAWYREHYGENEYEAAIAQSHTGFDAYSLAYAATDDGLEGRTVVFSSAGNADQKGKAQEGTAPAQDLPTEEVDDSANQPEAPPTEQETSSATDTSVNSRLAADVEALGGGRLRASKTEDADDGADPDRKQTIGGKIIPAAFPIGVDEDAGWDGVRRVYLTFDDGPSSSTEEILDILDQYGVKATFFVTGREDTYYLPMYRRIVEDGHTLGMHSYSHKYSEIYASLDAFQADLHRLQTFLYETTGIWCKLYRFPGGSSNTVSRVDMSKLADYLVHEDIVYYDWNVASGDDRAGTTTEILIQNVLTGVPKFHTCIVLMHDAADKKHTVEALPQIIEAIQQMDNTVLLPITENTESVKHREYE